MHVVFVEPSFPANQRQFARALHQVGARVTAIGERPVEHLDGELSGWLHAYERVGSVCDERALLDVVRRVQSRGRVDRLEATVEAHILPVARVREAAGIPGTSVRTAFLCRDKPAMKQALREAGFSGSWTLTWDNSARAKFRLLLHRKLGSTALRYQKRSDARTAGSRDRSPGA